MPISVDNPRLSELEASLGPEFIGQLLEGFVHDSVPAVLKLSEAAARLDAAEVAAWAHRFKGACRNLGYDDIAGSCEQIEHQARAGSIHHTLVSRVSQQAAELFGAIQRSRLSVQR